VIGPVCFDKRIVRFPQGAFVPVRAAELDRPGCFAIGSPTPSMVTVLTRNPEMV
jgi:hypothetical protein